VDGTPHRGYRIDDGAYEDYARSVDPLGDEVCGAGEKHLASHTDLAGDGFSAMGGEAGFTGAYQARMRSLQGKVAELGGKWRQMGDAARRTGANFDGIEADQQDVLNRLGGDLR
jgi:hypothetical protein